MTVLLLTALFVEVIPSQNHTGERKLSLTSRTDDFKRLKDFTIDCSPPRSPGDIGGLSIRPKTPIEN
jgi:hypothetical protein